MDTVHCSLYSVHCSLYSVHCSLYTAHCALFTVHTGTNFLSNNDIITPEGWMSLFDRQMIDNLCIINWCWMEVPIFCVKVCFAPFPLLPSQWFVLSGELWTLLHGKTNLLWHCTASYLTVKYDRVPYIDVIDIVWYMDPVLYTLHCTLYTVQLVTWQLSMIESPMLT